MHPSGGGGPRLSVLCIPAAGVSAVPKILAVGAAAGCPRGANLGVRNDPPARAAASLHLKNVKEGARTTLPVSPRETEAAGRAE